ncbi:hypothetical protein ACSSS7_006669 [Eimeria intestinalis]
MTVTLHRSSSSSSKSSNSTSSSSSSDGSSSSSRETGTTLATREDSASDVVARQAACRNSMACPPTAAAAADAAHEEQESEQLQQQQHSFAVRAVAAEAAAAAGELFDGSMKEKLAQMLLLLQDDDSPPQPHLQQEQQQQHKQQGRERWQQQQQQEEQHQRHRSRHHASTRPKNRSKAAREEAPSARAAHTSSSSSNSSSCSGSSSNSEGEDGSRCSKCRRLQQRLRLERLRRRAEDGEAKQLIARVAAQVTRLSRDAREAAAAAAAAAATAAHQGQQQHLKEQQRLLQEERRRSQALEGQVESLRAQLNTQQQQQQQQTQKEGESRPEHQQLQVHLLQHQLSSMMQQLLGQADPMLQLLLLRLERLGLRLQQLQQRQQRREQHLLLQQHRLLHQQEGELQHPTATCLSPLMSGQPQLQQQQQLQHLRERDDPFNRVRDTDSSSTRNVVWGTGGWLHSGMPSPRLSANLVHQQEQQEQQQQQQQEGRPMSVPSEGRLMLMPQQRPSHAPSDACACLAGHVISRPSTGSSCGHNGILTPAAAFARAAAAAEGLLVPPFSGGPPRLCNCSCSLRMTGERSPLQRQQRVFRQRSSLLSNAGVGRRALEAPCRPLSAVAAVPHRAATVANACAADSGGSNHAASPAPSCLQRRHSNSVVMGRLLDAVPAAARTPLETPLSAPEGMQSGAPQREALVAAGNGNLGTLQGAGQPTDAAHAVSVTINSPPESPQQQQEEAAASVLASADRGHLLSQAAPLRALPSAAATRQRMRTAEHSSSSSGSSPALCLATPCSSPLSSASSHLRDLTRLHAWQAPHTLQQQPQALLPRSDDGAAEVQDGEREARQAEEATVPKEKEATLAGNREGQIAPESVGEEAAFSTNMSVFTEGATQQVQSIDMQQHQLTQSYSGSVSSVDFQQLAALQVPLRQLLNDQQSLLETLDADYKGASFAAPIGYTGRVMVAKREADNGQVGEADVQVHSTGRWHHREVEVTLSLPMSFLGVNNEGEGESAQRPPSSSPSKAGR